MKTTIKNVNKTIGKIWPGIELVQGNGYVYVSSDDDALALKLAGLCTTSIPVCRISQMSINQWIDSTRYVLADEDRFEFEREPVFENLEPMDNEIRMKQFRKIFLDKYAYVSCDLSFPTTLNFLYEPWIAFKKLEYQVDKYYDYVLSQGLCKVQA